jgi:hypothetical protein
MAFADMARLKREAYVAHPERWAINIVRSAPLGLRSLVSELHGKMTEDEILLLLAHTYGPAQFPEHLDSLLYFLAEADEANVTYNIAMANPAEFRNVVDRLDYFGHYPIEYWLPRGATFATTLEQVVQRCRAGVAVQGDTIFHSQLAVQAPPAITADGLTIYLISYIRKRDVTRWLWAGGPDWWWLAAVEPSGAEYIGTVHRTHVEGHLLVNDRRVDYVYDDRAPPPECVLETGQITFVRVVGQVQHAMAPPPNNVILLAGLSKNRLPATERVIELLRQALANGLLINQAGLEAVTDVCQAGCGTTNGKIPFCGTMQIAYATESFTDKCIERKQFGYGEGQVARELWGGIDVFMFQLEAVLSDQNTYYDNNLDLAEYQLQGRILGGELDGPRTHASEDGPLISGRIIAIKALHGPRLDGYAM